jgi:DNA-binding protein H-NS
VNTTDLKAGEKIRQLEDQLKQLRKEAKSNIIEQMRKHKLVEIKIPASDDM